MAASARVAFGPEGVLGFMVIRCVLDGDNIHRCRYGKWASKPVCEPNERTLPETVPGRTWQTSATLLVAAGMGKAGVVSQLQPHYYFHYSR